MRDLSNKLDLFMDQILTGVNCLDSFLGFHMDLFPICDGEVSDLMRDKAANLFSPSYRAAAKGSGRSAEGSSSGLLGGESAGGIGTLVALVLVGSQPSLSLSQGVVVATTTAATTTTGRMTTGRRRIPTRTPIKVRILNSPPLLPLWKLGIHPFSLLLLCCC